MKRIFTIVFLLGFSFSFAQKRRLVVDGYVPGLYFTYNVQPKETFTSIAALYNLHADSLSEFNNMDFYDGELRAKTLKIPLVPANFTQEGKLADSEVLVPVYHLVRYNESVEQVSSKVNRIPIAAIKKWNQIGSNPIPRGTYVLIGFLKAKQRYLAYFEDTVSTEFASFELPVKSVKPKIDTLAVAKVQKPVDKPKSPSNDKPLTVKKPNTKVDIEKETATRNRLIIERRKADSLLAANNAATKAEKRKADSLLAVNNAAKKAEKRIADSLLTAANKAAEKAKKQKADSLFAVNIAAKKAEKRKADSLFAVNIAEEQAKKRRADSLLAINNAEKRAEKRKSDSLLALNIAAKKAEKRKVDSLLAVNIAAKKAEKRKADSLLAVTSAEEQVKKRRADSILAVNNAEKRAEKRKADSLLVVNIAAKKAEKRLADSLLTAAKKMEKWKADSLLAASNAAKKAEKQKADSLLAANNAAKKAEQHIADSLLLASMEIISSANTDTKANTDGSKKSTVDSSALALKGNNKPVKVDSISTKVSGTTKKVKQPEIKSPILTTKKDKPGTSTTSTTVAKTPNSTSTSNNSTVEKPAVVVSAPLGFANFASIYTSEMAAKAEKRLSGEASYFQSKSGWSDKKFYVLIPNVAPGTIVKVTANDNRSVYAKVLGPMPDMKENNGIMLRLSDAAVVALGVQKDKFPVVVSYY